MSEYQRYEWMTMDQPLTRAQLAEVEGLSSHIEASSTHAVVEYNWGDFKHNPIKILRKYFDGFLYWANWGSPQLGLRFPHGALPANLLEGYNFDDCVEFTQHPDFDILHIQFSEMEAPDEWVDYELGPLMPLRDELMAGDLRSLYILWLADQTWGCGGDGDYDEEEDEDEEDEYDEYEDEDEDEGYVSRDRTKSKQEEYGVPLVPPGFGELTGAQRALAELFRVSEEQLIAVARHSSPITPSAGDDVVAWVKLLSATRRDDYLVRLARNEPGLSRKLVLELRELGRDKTQAPPPAGEHVSYKVLEAESKAIADQLEREEQERQRVARLQHLQDIHDNQHSYWQQADQAASRGVASGYDEALKLVTELRDVAQHYQEMQSFEDRFATWIQAHLRRPALLKRLRERKFSLPEM